MHAVRCFWGLDGCKLDDDDKWYLVDTPAEQTANLRSPRTSHSRKSSSDSHSRRESSDSHSRTGSDVQMLAKELKAILQPFPEGIGMTDLAKRYQKHTGDVLRPQQYKFDSLSSMLRSMSEVCPWVGLFP